MALKNMTVQEMVSLSGAWVDPKNEAHAQIQSVPRLKGLLPDIAASHDGIFAVVPKDNPRLAEISQLASEHDSLHDLLARGIYGYLTEMALLTDEGEPLIHVRDALMPEGLSPTIHASYRAQAGHVALIRERLNATMKETLQAIPLPGGANLYDRVQAWIATGDRLGQLEEERSRLVKNKPSFGTQTIKARHQWVRTVNALVSVAALADLDEATDRIIFGPLRDAEGKADTRCARRSAASVPESVEASGAQV